MLRVTRKFQVTIPECVRAKGRKRFKLGRKLSVEDVERAIGEGLKQCLDNSGR